MAKCANEIIKMKSSESTECYWTTKNRKTSTEKLERKKYDRKLRKHTVFKEAK